MDKAKRTGSPSSGRLKRVGKTPLHFFINKNLHRRLHINRGTNEMTTWCYPLDRRITYTYTDAKARMEPAFSTREVSEMLNRSIISINMAMYHGHLQKPQSSYSIGSGKKHRHYWHEDDIMAAHDYYSTLHRGRPRNDGLITPQHLPTKRELRAMIRGDNILYVQNANGEFVPTWRAEEF